MKKNGFSFVIATLISTTAYAQEPPLIGTWLSTYMDPQGKQNTATAAQFLPNGQLIIRMSVSGSGGSGQWTWFWSYQMTSPRSYTERLIDWEPKQDCGVVCLPRPSIIPIGTVGSCKFEFQSQYVVDIQCDNGSPIRYTRQGS